MSSAARADVPPQERRWNEITDRLGEIMGQVNALMGEASELALAVHEERLLGGTGVRSLTHFLEWQLGLAPTQARQLATIAKRRNDLPETISLLDEGLLTVDQVGPIAARLPADPKGDRAFAELAPNLTVKQIRKAVRSTVPPDQKPKDPESDDDGDDPSGDVRNLSFGHRDDGTWGAQVNANTAAGALFESGLRSHFDALMLEWKHVVNHLEDGQEPPPKPTWFDALERVFDRSLEREATDRPHCQRTRILMHVDAESDLARLHLGPALSAAERTMLGCDASVATVLERNGIPVSVGREHRIVPDKTRTLVEQRDGGCAVPWCGTTKYLVVHHIVYWDDGGVTETWNLICLCPHHHRAVHRGDLHISGNADEPGGLVITDATKRRRLTGRSAARPPTEPLPHAPNRYDHPWGTPMDWRYWAPPHIATDTRLPETAEAA